MTGRVLGLALVVPLLLAQACGGPTASSKQFQTVTIAVDGMGERNGVL